MTRAEGEHHEHAVAQAIPLDVGNGGRSHNGADRRAITSRRSRRADRTLTVVPVRHALGAGPVAIKGGALMARGGYRTFDADTHIIEPVEPIEQHLSAADRAKLVALAIEAVSRP